MSTNSERKETVEEISYILDRVCKNCYFNKRVERRWMCERCIFQNDLHELGSKLTKEPFSVRGA